MAFSFKQRECDTCGGTLEFNKESDEYVCLYCGNRYEREERYDGQFSVRYAATQTLSALLDVDDDLNNWDLVQTNLNDCQKIDPSYPGSIVAHLAASIVRVRSLMGNREAVRTDLVQAQSDYAKLGGEFDPQKQDVEADFYDGLESADIRSLLIGVFVTFKDQARADYIGSGFNADTIHSQKAANDLASRSFASGDFQRIDELLQSPAKLDFDMLFARLLKEYPESEQKIENISAVIVRGVNEQSGRDALSDYLENSADSTSTRLQIATGCIGRGIIPRGKALASLIDAAGDDKRLLSLFTLLKGDVLSDTDVEAVTGALLAQADADVIAKSLSALADAGYYLSFPQKAMMDMLTRGDLPVDSRISVYKAVVSIGLPNKRRQSVFAAFVEATCPAEDKVAIIHAVAESMPAVNPMTVESYLMLNGIDGEGKPQVLTAMLDHVTAKETLKLAAKRYTSASVDAQAVHMAVEGVLRDADLLAGGGARYGSQSGVRSGVPFDSTNNSQSGANSNAQLGGQPGFQSGSGSSGGSGSNGSANPNSNINANSANANSTNASQQATSPSSNPRKPAARRPGFFGFGRRT